MKTLIKTILAAGMALSMLSASAVAAGAATGYNTNDGSDPANPLSDTTSFTFTKHYDLEGDTTDGKSPAENFTVTFTPKSFFNVPASANMTVAGMPAIANAVLSASKGAADTSAATNVTAEVTLPAYAYVGDYWYEVRETAGDTAGVTYDSAVYYLHVQVVHESDSSDNLLRLVTLHSAEPQAGGTPAASGDTKNDGITNTYRNGSLSVKKTVTGNMGDLTKEYTATVTFSYTSDAAACPVRSDVTYTDGTEKTIAASNWTKADGKWTASATLTLSHDETVTFENLPYGVSYEVVETDYSGEGYTHSFAFENADSGDAVTAEGGTWANAKATGTITDAEDKLTITNNKESEIDVGVLLENAPFIALIVFVLAAAVILIVFAVKRNKHDLT